MTGWDQPLVSVDVVALRVVNGEAKYATHERRVAPFAGEHALPGVLLLTGETLAGATWRALREKLGMKIMPSLIQQFGAFDGTNRDPRGATISIGHLAVVADAGNADVAWHSVGDAVELPFDHSGIVSAARAELGMRLWVDTKLTRALLGTAFTTRNAIDLTRQLGAQLPERESNLARWLRTRGGAEHDGVASKSTLWRWA